MTLSLKNFGHSTCGSRSDAGQSCCLEDRRKKFGALDKALLAVLLGNIITCLFAEIHVIQAQEKVGSCISRILCVSNGEY